MNQLCECTKNEKLSKSSPVCEASSLEQCTLMMRLLPEASVDLEDSVQMSGCEMDLKLDNLLNFNDCLIFFFYFLINIQEYSK